MHTIFRNNASPRLPLALRFPDGYFFAWKIRRYIRPFLKDGFPRVFQGVFVCSFSGRPFISSPTDLFVVEDLKKKIVED